MRFLKGTVHPKMNILFDPNLTFFVRIELGLQKKAENKSTSRIHFLSQKKLSGLHFEHLSKTLQESGGSQDDQ